MNQKVNIDGLQKAIQEITKEYTEEVKEVVDDVLPKVAKETVKELKKTSPKRHGDYAKGWKQKIEKDRVTGSTSIVYNKTRYQLTHLLEKGHANRNGGRTQGIPHIKPAEEHAVKNVLDGIKEGLR